MDEAVTYRGGGGCVVCHHRWELHGQGDFRHIPCIGYDRATDKFCNCDLVEPPLLETTQAVAGSRNP